MGKNRFIPKIIGIFTALSFIFFGGVVVSVTAPVNAADVTREHCVADVSPTTGVSVHVTQNDDCVVKFTSSSTVTWTRPTGITSFEILVVAGGGGGGAHPEEDAGGGGGGGVVHVPTLSLSESRYDISVGQGGTGNNANPPRCSVHPWYAGENGGSSSFGVSNGAPLIRAFGGGGGGGACEVGFSGGSGGGGHCSGTNTAATKGDVAASITNARLYGNVGGSSHSCRTGSGGGGGASAPGQNGTATKAGDGGEGISLDILGSGTPVVYGSGGGGAGAAETGLNPSITGGVGGANGGDAKRGDGVTGPEHHGVDGTGSGGGAQLCPTRPPGTISCPAGQGGDGVVIIRYSLSSAVAPPESPTNSETAEAPVVNNETATTSVAVTQPVTQQPARRVNRNTKAKTPTATKNVASGTTIPTPSTTAPVVKPTAPQPPESQPGEAKAIIDGEATDMAVTRRDDQLSVSFGALSSTLSSVTSSGTRRPLDGQGNVRFEEGDSLQLAATGFAADSDIEVWLFSEPKDLGIIRTTVLGEAESLLTVPTDITPGNHRVVVTGTSRSGSNVVVAVGIIVGASTDGVTTAQKFFIALPISAAIIAGLVIPTRRRRKVELA